MKMRRAVANVCLVVFASVGAFAACGHDDGAAPPPPKLSQELLQDPQTCGQCHADHLREWSGSMHAYAGVDPVFLALNKRMQRETNGALGNFCVQCHAPLAVKAGLTKDGLNLGQLDPKLLGVNCYFCHQSEFVSGDFHNNPLVVANDGVMRGGIVDPVPNTAHEAMYSTSADHVNDRSAQFCGSCHDILNPKGTNIERTFVEWRKSHFAVEDRKNCGACHMPERTGLAAQAPGVLVRKVHDHSMQGVDTALTPFPERDAQKAGVQKNLDDAISARLCVTADSPSGVRVDVTLLSEKVGHSWPSGAAQDRRAWVELEGRRAGAVAFTSGQIAERAAVAASVDPQILVLRDVHYDDKDRETHFFWNTVRFESKTLPVARTSGKSDADRSIVKRYTFPGALPDKVTMRVKIRAIDFDLIEELVASGDLDPAVADQVPTFTVASTVLSWAPGADCVSTPLGK